MFAKNDGRTNKKENHRMLRIFFKIQALQMYFIATLWHLKAIGNLNIRYGP